MARPFPAATVPITTDVDLDAVSTLSVDLSRATRRLFAAGGVEETLGLVLALATLTVEGCDFAGILLLAGDTATIPARTDPVAEHLDTFQLRHDEGPSMDAIAQHLIFSAPDFTDEVRWPRLAAEAATRNVRGLLAVPLLTDVVLGSLNLYAYYPQAFGVVDRARALLLGALAAESVASAQTHEDDERQTANLHEGLASRELIGQAQGILIERERITADQAFGILRRASQHLNLKLSAVAQSLVDTGETPDTGHRRAAKR
jgi:hypothetical protein